MGVLTTAQIGGLAPLPFPIPEISTAHRSVPVLVWELLNKVLM